MTRGAFLIGACLLLLGGVPAYGWGSAAHAYIACELLDNPETTDLTTIYGACLPDAFNVMFGDPYQGPLWTQTHYEFMKLVDEAESETDKALARGFASHNELWGADRTAHISSINYPESGYVIQKSEQLAVTLKPQVRMFLLFSGVPNPDAVVEDVLPTVAHTAIETAVDLLICQNEDPDMGQRLALAARARGWAAPILLSKAFATDLATAAGVTEAVAAPLIIAAENEFRYQIEWYGTALAQDDPVDALSEQACDLARLLMAAEHGIIVDLPVTLMRQILDAAIEAVEDDYAAELAATITYVRTELESHGVAQSAL